MSRNWPEPLRIALQRQQHRHGRVQAGDHVHHGQADAGGFAIGLAIHAHQAAHGLGASVAGQAAQRPVGAKPLTRQWISFGNAWLSVS